jgi:hypothetical protein
MRRGHRAGIAAALAVVAAAAVTAGCGGGSALSLDPVAAAATKTQHAGAARIQLALAVSAPRLQSGKTVHVSGAGAIDGTSSELTFTSGQKSVKEISLEENGDYIAYLQLHSFAAFLPADKPWIEVDLSKLGKSAGLDLGSLLAGSQVQPGDLLTMLGAEGAKIQNLGPATVDGAATTHYRVTIDTAKALQAKGLPAPLVAGALAQLPAEIPADVWIGADGLVHRLQVSLGVAQGHLSLTMNLSDYGAPVTITAPPTSDVFDATSLAQQGIGSGLSH